MEDIYHFVYGTLISSDPVIRCDQAVGVEDLIIQSHDIPTNTTIVIPALVEAHALILQEKAGLLKTQIQPA